jgi:phenylacetate-coenzyme A ligase PaaK-like adenylate-forming protein
MVSEAIPPSAGTTRDFSSDLWERIRAVERVPPAWLASLMRHAGSAGARGTALRHVLQNFLLARTLAHARRNVPHYDGAEYDGWEPSEPGGAPCLDGLPILDREAVAARPEEFLASDVTVRSICHTSGTTGAPLDLYKSHEEIEFIQDYYRQLFAPLVASLASRPLVLTLPNVNHGVPVPMPGIGMTFVAGVTDDTLIRDARRVLERSFPIAGHDSRISILSGLPHHVLLLTSYLIEQGLDPRELGLHGLTVTGGYLAMNWIRFLAESWGCLVHDRFTLTEAIGGASRVPGTDVYELDPHIVGEVVDPDSGCSTDHEVGVLVLTNLHPFVQMQPLVRYNVGDLVRRVEGPGPLRFQFLGKVCNCVSWRPEGRREWLLFSARVNDLLSDIPDVNVYEWFSNVRTVHDRTIGSLPMLSVSAREHGERISLRVELELRYAPHTRPDRVDALRREIVSGLRSTAHSVLAERMDSGQAELDVCFAGPGALKAPLVIKV